MNPFHEFLANAFRDECAVTSRWAQWAFIIVCVVVMAVVLYFSVQHEAEVGGLITKRVKWSLVKCVSCHVDEKLWPINIVEEK